MPKQSTKRKNVWKWRRSGGGIAPRQWLAALALAALMAAAAWAATRLPSLGTTLPDRPAVVIERVMTSNPCACYPVNGRFYDWVELRNTTDEPVRLDGWRLSDDLDMRGAFAFGQVELPAGESLVLYCADAPSDAPPDAIFTGFKLDSDGDLLLLTDAAGRWQQMIKVPALGAARLWQREEDGEYRAATVDELLETSPRYAATVRPPYDPDGLFISEAMALNRLTLADEDGEYCDWLELHNGSDAPIDLTGYTLSDAEDNRRKWALPAMTLDAGAYRLIFASGKDRADPAGELHANFRLSASGEAVRLYDPQGEAVSYVEFGECEPDASLSRRADGELSFAMEPTPGYENTRAGARSAMSALRENELGLYINEIMASGSGYDWVELRNTGASAIDLSGMGLSDEMNHPRKWQFPEGSSIPGGGYVLVALTGSGGDTGVRGGIYGADIGLSAGETACLCLPDGTLLDAVRLFDSPRNLSYGRAEGFERYRYFTDPTPGEANSRTSYERKAAEVEFSVPGGQQAAGTLSVELSADPDAQIYYTTDGTPPTARSKRYSGPIEVKSNTVIQAIAWRDGLIASDVAGRTYLPGVGHSVPLVCVSGRRSELNGSNGALNTGVKGAGSDVYVEIYDADGTQLIGQQCLFKVAGHDSRVKNGQKAFSLRAKGQYPLSTFAAELFSRRDYTEYKSIVMRASGQDWKKTHMRDAVLSSLAGDTSVYYQESEVAVVYINGEYWGLYNMRERICKESVAQFMGWDDPENVDIIEGGGARTSYHATHGSSAGFSDMVDWVERNGLSDDANVEQLREQMDIENYLEYVMLEMFTINRDLNNVRMYRNRQRDGKWRWILCDLDLSWGSDTNNVEDWLTGNSAGPATPQDNTLFKAMMKNAKLRDWFLTRFGELLNTTFSPDSLYERIKARYEIMKPEMPANCKRWNWSMDTWNSQGRYMLKLAGRRARTLAGYLAEEFDLTEEQARGYFGDALTAGD